jgi:AcrR family transcriptional regulator
VQEQHQRICAQRLTLRLDRLIFVEAYSIENRVVKRQYRSPRRLQQAQRTRQAILTAARRLFVAQGYGATTIESISKSAGVAVQTVYAAFGSKRRMLIALLDRMAADADLPRLERELAAAAGDPGRQVRELLAFTGRFYASGRDLIELARSVSGVERDLAEMWRTGEDRRYRAHAALIAEWVRMGWLSAGPAARAAHDLLWALSGPDVFRLLVVERHWSQRRRVDIISRLLEVALPLRDARPLSRSQPA